MRSPERPRDRKREITPQGGWPCHNPFSSILLLGSWACTHTHTWHEFKPPGPGRELWSTTWESSDIAITLTAGSHTHLYFLREIFCYRVCAPARQTERDRETESEKSPPRGDGHATIPSPPVSSQDLGHSRTHAWHEFQITGPET